jgi:hypothetical protein
LVEASHPVSGASGAPFDFYRRDMHENLEIQPASRAIRRTTQEPCPDAKAGVKRLVLFLFTVLE